MNKRGLLALVPALFLTLAAQGRGAVTVAAGCEAVAWTSTSPTPSSPRSDAADLADAASRLPGTSTSTSTSTSTAWPDWVRFREGFISADGRVIDASTPLHQTTSEGQSYALFFALVANDRAAFDRLLRWTQDNLAAGDLSARLPAWLWGRRQDAAGQVSWGVIDANAASDADLWIVYALGEAARLWNAPPYAALAQALAARVLREEVVDISPLGPTLLPGPWGFAPGSGTEPGSYRLNPSYVPPQLLRRLARLYPDTLWPRVAASSLTVLRSSAPRGYAPDWVLHQAGAFTADPRTQGVGSYDAIRVYLWAGMVHEADPARAILLDTFAPMVRQVADMGQPPLRVDTATGNAQGAGPAGFSAALLPLLQVAGQAQAAEAQRQRLSRPPLGPVFAGRDNYYDQVLALFGVGWFEGQYRFAPDGALLPRWSCAAP
ncbi:endo-1,4-D-glucanase [Hylemonella gracilis ATCC 19624]|uniref:cellulase n=2 Tax=Hylemonella gracilis TaxID=80880 RepID=F3KQB5_9BURK|nr:endo-1,4-D-glucanase [Hylemonella gracilis ATCC 19624]